MVNDALATNNTATTPGTQRTMRVMRIHLDGISIKAIIYHLVKITRIEYLTSTQSVTSLHMSRNIVALSVMRPTNTNTVKRTFVKI